MVQRGSSEYPRQARDTYPTPREPIMSLLRVVSFNKRVCDPCCGGGQLMRVVAEHAYKVCGFDIEPWGQYPKLNFLFDTFPFTEPDVWSGYPDILTNPPYGVQGRLAMAFIERSLAVTSQWSGKVAMLLPVDFDHGKTRQHVFRDCPAFKHRVILLDRIKWFNNEAGSEWNTWFVWDWTNRAKPTVIYV